jgi:hypothetical protein
VEVNYRTTTKKLEVAATFEEGGQFVMQLQQELESAK